MLNFPEGEAFTGVLEEKDAGWISPREHVRAHCEFIHG